jgi:hypothetical protein
MPQEIRVQLNLTGFAGDPKRLSEIIGLTPSKTWLAGEAIERSKRKYESNGWRVSAPRDVDDVEAGVDALFGYLAPRWESLRNVSQLCRVELSIVVYAERQVPAIHFRDDQIRRLIELSGKIDVDVYCLADE